MSWSRTGGIEVHRIVSDELAPISLGNLLRKDATEQPCRGFSSSCCISGCGGVGTRCFECNSMVTDKFRISTTASGFCETSAILFFYSIDLALKMRITCVGYSSVILFVVNAGCLHEQEMN